MKPWYRSWTLCANAAVVGLAYWFRGSTFYVDPLWFVWAIAGLNIALRMRTSEAVRWR